MPASSTPPATSRSSTAPRTSAACSDGTLFAPKYIENKLKFYPNIKEAVAFGDGRDSSPACINIDLVAVGNWAERNNVVYGSYQELAGHPLVYDMIEQHVDEVNRSLPPTRAAARRSAAS